MLRRKLWRDLWQNRTQFLSIFLMAFLGMMVFAGIDAESNGLGVSYTRYFEQTRTADYWVIGNNFTKRDADTLKSLPEVETVDRKLVLDGKCKLPTGEELDMEFNFMETMTCSYPYVVEGEPFNASSTGIWLEQNFANARGYKVGDTINLSYEGVSFQEEVKGIIMHPEYVYYSLDSDSMMPTYGNYGFGFLSQSEFPLQDQLVYNYLVIKTYETPENSLQFKEYLKNTLNLDEVTVIDRRQNLGIDTVINEKEQHETFGIMFTAIFMLIAVMGIVTTMTRMTSNQRTQIGTLKALGFSKGKITWHYVSYGIVISLLGGVLGSLLGRLLIPQLFLGSMTAYFILPAWYQQLSWKSLVANALSVLVCSSVSFLSCRKELKDMPAVTLRPASPKNLKHSLLEKSKFWLSMNFSTQWNIRDVLRNKSRSLMGILGVAGCAMLLLGAFGAYDCCIGLVDWQYTRLVTGQNKVNFSLNTSDLEKRQMAQTYKGQLLQEGSCEFRVGDTVKTGTITVTEEGNYLHYENTKQEEIKLPKDGIAMTSKMADLLGVQVGDTFEWHIVGEKKWETGQVAALYQAATGQGITMDKEVYEDFRYDFHPTSFYTNMSIPSYIKDGDVVAGVISIEQARSDLAKNMEMMYIMVGVLIVAAVLLGLVVLYNMGVLSFMEKTREVATLKVLGFSTKQIRKILQQQNIWITVIGIVIGLWLGYWLLVVMMGTMSDDMDMPVTVNLLSYLYAIVGTGLVSLSVNRMLPGRVKTICMVDALKGVE